MRYLLAALLFFSTNVAAEQVAVATDNGDTIELHDVIHGKCPAGVKEATYIYKSGQKVDGCWKFFSDQDVIALIFEDGDALVVKVDRFTWKRGRKPVST